MGLVGLVDSVFGAIAAGVTGITFRSAGAMSYGGGTSTLVHAAQVGHRGVPRCQDTPLVFVAWLIPCARHTHGRFWPPLPWTQSGFVVCSAMIAMVAGFGRQLACDYVGAAASQSQAEGFRPNHASNSPQNPCCWYWDSQGRCVYAYSCASVSVHICIRTYVGICMHTYIIICVSNTALDMQLPPCHRITALLTKALFKGWQLKRLMYLNKAHPRLFSDPWEQVCTYMVQRGPAPPLPPPNG